MSAIEQAEQRPGDPVVLVVDDDPVTRMFVGRALKAIGFRARDAESGEEALRAIEAGPPHLVLLDVDMPGMDGFETCAEIRKLDSGRELPVMIATGLTDASTVDRAFEVGASDYIQKPIDRQILQHRVRFLMRAYGAFADLRRTIVEQAISEKRLANAQRLASLGDWQWVPDADEMLWSAEVHRILRIERRAGASSYAAFLGATHPEDRLRVEKAMLAAACEGTGWRIEHRIVTADGETRIVQQQAEVSVGANAAVERVVGTIQDVTELKRSEERIHFLANYDPLTLLPNRRMLTEHLDRLLYRCRQSGGTVALLCLNIDRFKRINETLGPESGDLLLRAFAKRLSDRIRATDLVAYLQPGDEHIARLGNDEFTVVLDRVRTGEDAALVARRILESLREPVSIAGRDIVLSSSVGIAVFPGDGEGSDALLRSANAAMSQAKRHSPGSYCFSSASLNENAVRKLRVEVALRAALDSDQLALHYQPMFDCRTGEMIAAEALARWESPELGSVSPGEFIPLAEDVGLIEQLGEWVLRSACRRLRGWLDAGLDPVPVSVNASSHQFRSGRLLEAARSALEQSSIDAGLLEIELTESALISESAAITTQLSGLKKLGVKLAVDDFGTGYSSLRYLASFPIDIVKVDRSFVMGLGKEDHANSIVSAVIAMARGLGMETVAEGVETEAQARFLRGEGCSALQGFLYSKPVDPDAFARLLAGRRSHRQSG